MIELPPTIAVFGYKDSGKTTVVTALIGHLTDQGHRVLAAKHVGEPGFMLDQQGTDSFRFAQAGATAVLLHSDVNSTLLVSRPASEFVQLVELGVASTSADVLLLEGFRFLAQHQPQIAKIVCVRSKLEIPELVERVQDQLLAICTLKPNIPRTLQIPHHIPELERRLDSWLATAPSVRIVIKE